MKYTTMKAIVSGTNCKGEAFTITCEFKLIPPEDGGHYGTGYYMTVRLPGDRHLVDVRYERTTDISILADRWIQNWFGKNAKEVVKEFPAVETSLYRGTINAVYSSLKCSKQDLEDQLKRVDQGRKKEIIENQLSDVKDALRVFDDLMDRL